MPKTKAKSAVAKIYAVVGSDDVEVKHTAVELADKLKPAAAGDFGLETIDGAADNARPSSSTDKIDNRGAANFAILRRRKIGLAEKREFPW